VKQCDWIPCIFPFISYGYNIMWLSLNKENSLQVFEIKMEKNIWSYVGCHKIINVSGLYKFVTVVFKCVV
jgi:hypothetical protein